VRLAGRKCIDTTLLKKKVSAHEAAFVNNQNVLNESLFAERLDNLIYPGTERTVAMPGSIDVAEALPMELHVLHIRE